MEEQRLGVQLELHVHRGGRRVLRNGLAPERVDGVDGDSSHRFDRAELIDASDDVTRRDQRRDFAQQAH